MVPEKELSLYGNNFTHCGVFRTYYRAEIEVIPETVSAADGSIIGYQRDGIANFVVDRNAQNFYDSESAEPIYGYIYDFLKARVILTRIH